jgi:hypothetical protein
MTRTEIPIPETITAWQCIGCGRLESPQNCIGVCQDRKVEVVSARDCAEVLSALEDAYERIAMLEAFLRRLARIVPREGRSEETYRALQAEARKLLGGGDTG